MANTVIQLKKSTTAAAPSSLNVAEPAYSYVSDKLFIGGPSNEVIEIGGRYYVNVAVAAWNTANTANDRAVAAFNAANGAIASSSGPAFNQANAAFLIANAAFDKANSANLLAFNTGIGANAFAAATIAGANTAVGAGANAFAAATIAGANTAVGGGANAFSAATIAGANTAVGAGANAFSAATIAGANTAVGAGANNFLLAVIAGANTAVGAGANNFLLATLNGANTAVGLGANNYANTAFVRLTGAATQAITGNIIISGSLSVSGNTYRIDANTLFVQDPLIYLAGNNSTSDIADIGFVGLYNNATAINVHTGLIRDATAKEYFLFDRYSAVPNFNDIDPNGNNFTLAVLNAALRTSNLTLGSQNTIVWITGAYDKANAANLLAFNTGIGANAFAAATIAGANTAVGAGANAFAAVTIAGANTAVGAGANAFAAATIAGANTAVGAGANAYAALIGSIANTNAGNISYTNTGTLNVFFGGTGLNTAANNGVLFGNGVFSMRVTAAGTEGNVLQVNNQGTPFFGMLDGGLF